MIEYRLGVQEVHGKVEVSAAAGVMLEASPPASRW
jgi:hypothetical protein